MEKMASNGFSRATRSGRTPHFLTVGLLIVICILAFNYWNVSSHSRLLQKQVTEMSKTLEDLALKKVHLEKRSESCQTQVTISNQELKKLQDEVEQCMDERGFLQREKDTLSGKIDDAERALEECRESLSEAQRTQETFKMEYEECVRSCNETENDYQKLMTEKDKIVNDAKRNAYQLQAELDEVQRTLSQAQEERNRLYVEQQQLVQKLKVQNAQTQFIPGQQVQQVQQLQQNNVPPNHMLGYNQQQQLVQQQPGLVPNQPIVQANIPSEQGQNVLFRQQVSNVNNQGAAQPVPQQEQKGADLVAASQGVQNSPAEEVNRPEAPKEVQDENDPGIVQLENERGDSVKAVKGEEEEPQGVNSQEEQQQREADENGEEHIENNNNFEEIEREEPGGKAPVENGNEEGREGEQGNEKDGVDVSSVAENEKGGEESSYSSSVDEESARREMFIEEDKPEEGRVPGANDDLPENNDEIGNEDHVHLEVPREESDKRQEEREPDEEDEEVNHLNHLNPMPPA